jgi:hypothetical protein
MICSPDPANVNQSVTCNAAVRDIDNGVRAVFADVTSPANVTTAYSLSPIDAGLYSFTFPNTSLPGDYTVTWFAADFAGNENSSLTAFSVKSLLVHVDVLDAHGQTDKTVNPGEGITIFGNASYGPPFTGPVVNATVDITVDGKHYSGTTDGSGYYSISGVAPEALGNYTLDAAVVDRDGIRNSTAMALAVRSIKISAPPPFYTKPGVAVAISGEVRDAGQDYLVADVSIAVDIFYPNGTKAATLQDTTDAAGAYSVSYTPPEVFGTYKVDVSGVDAYGITGQNTTEFYVHRGYTVEASTDKPAYNPGEDVLASVSLYKLNGAWLPASSESVTIRLSDPEGNMIGEDVVTTDANGYANTTFPLPYDPGEYSLRAIHSKAEGYVKFKVRALTIAVDAGGPYMPSEAVEIRGRVFDAETGSPLGGLSTHIDIYDPAGGLINSTDVVADDLGYFTYAYILPATAVYGTYKVSVSAIDEARIKGQNSTAFDVGRIGVSLYTDKAAYNLRENVTIYGQVTDISTGLPIEGASVSISIRKAGELVYHLSMTTDAKGRYSDSRFKPPEADGYVVGVEALYKMDTAANSLEFRARSLTVTAYPTGTIDADEYGNGDRVQVEGNVTDSKTGELTPATLRIRIFFPNGTLANEATLYSSTGVYKYDQYYLPVDAAGESPKGVYQVYVDAVDDAGIVGSTSTYFYVGFGVKVWTDRTYYSPSQTVRIIVQLRDAPVHIGGQEVGITVYNATGGEYISTTVVTDADGMAILDAFLDPADPRTGLGVYRVVATPLTGPIAGEGLSDATDFTVTELDITATPDREPPIYSLEDDVTINGTVIDTLTAQGVVANLTLFINQHVYNITSSWNGEYSTTFNAGELGEYRTYYVDVYAVDYRGIIGFGNTTITGGELYITISFSSPRIYSPGDVLEGVIEATNFAKVSKYNLSFTIDIDGKIIIDKVIPELKSRETVTIPFEYRIPLDAEPRTYTITGKAFERGKLIGRGHAEFTVSALLVDISAKLTKPMATIEIRGDVVDTVTGTCVRDAQITIDVYGPSGEIVYVKKLLTDFSGSYSDAFRIIPNKANRGLYRILVTAIDREGIQGSASTTIVIEEPFKDNSSHSGLGYGKGKGKALGHGGGRDGGHGVGNQGQAGDHGQNGQHGQSDQARGQSGEHRQDDQYHGQGQK